MDLNFSVVNLLILFGAIQGLIFSLILIFNRKHPGAKFLALMMFALSYNGFETFHWSSGLSDHHFTFDLFPFVTIFCIGPSLYLYVQALLFPNIAQTRSDIFKHYAIVLFQFMFRAIILVYHLLWVNNVIKTPVTPTDADQLYAVMSEPFSVMFFIGYVTTACVLYRKAKRADTTARLKEERQSVYQWVNALLLCMVVLAVAWPLTIIAPYFIDIAYSAQYYPIEIGLVFFIYWVAFVGYYKTKVIYTKPTVLSGDQAKSFIAILEKTMTDDKLYQHPDLNLHKLARHTKISSKTISTVLNQYVGESFNEFVNKYRVREVQARLLKPENRHLTISGIALDCGFNSQATFQRVFKSTTGMSPKEYVNFQLTKAG
jgi:AraC-like DNA-binding protein